MDHTDFQSFHSTFNSGRTQLLIRWVPADLDTPVSAFLKIAHDTPYSFLLESVEGGKSLGRYSIIGLSPDLIWTCSGQDSHIQQHDMISPCETPPMDALRALITQSAIDSLPDDIPPMAMGGLFGHFGYDTIRLYEDIPNSNPDPLNLPDAVMMRPTMLLIFDNVKSQICIAQPIYAHAKNSNGNARALFDQKTAACDDVISALNTTSPRTQAETKQTDIDIHYHTDKDTYLQMVERMIEYINAGDIFQALPSQRFSFDFDLPAFDLYRALRRINPSPFLFYMNLNDFELVGSSPEIQVRVRDREMTIRPLAGTRKRGKDAAEDQALSEELLTDPKERAEHLMLIDLGRNDVGRVCDIGSVEVTEQFVIEYYSHVMHITSHVIGQLKQSCDILDAFFAGSPLGTVSGAPKIRAMEIIDELEPYKRKFYAGAVGYFSASGEMDTCVTLRTALVKDGRVFLQTGGGVVADSDPEFEYQESLNKAEAIIHAAREALAQAQQHL